MREQLTVNKEAVIDRFATHVSSGKVAFFRQAGIDFVLGRGLDAIIQHVFNAAASCIRNLPYQFKEDKSAGAKLGLPRLQPASPEWLTATVSGQTPSLGPAAAPSWASPEQSASG